MNDIIELMYNNKQFSDSEFLKAVYLVILRRNIDDNGKTYYLNKLNNGSSREDVITEVANSTEAKNKGFILPKFLEKNNNADKSLSMLSKTLKFSEKFVPNKYKGKYKLLGKSLKQNLVEYNNILKYDESAKKNLIVTKKGLSSNPNLKVNKVNSLNPQTQKSSGKKNQIWFDLTTSFEWQEGVVGIVRAELQVAKEIKALDSSVKFFMYLEQGFVEIKDTELTWLFKAESVADEYLKFFKRRNFVNREGEIGKIHIELPVSDWLFHPFKDNDLIFSMGWMDSDKEKYFSKLKKENNKIFLTYLIYDLILILENTKQFYHPEGNKKFKNYFKWISYNANYIYFGGETAKHDVIEFQKAHHWPVVPGKAVKFGSDAFMKIDDKKAESILKELGINRDFIITVGSIEPRKNHDTLYRSYLMALQKVESPEQLPLLVICGKPIYGTDDLVDSIDRNPLLKNNVLRLSPNEEQLATLYAKCLFTLLPSVYEGWSLTLPESLGQGKICLSADTPPLREIGEGLTEFIEPFDIEAWADKIIYYATHKQELLAKEKYLKENWHNVTWKDTAKTLLESFKQDVIPLDPTIKNTSYIQRTDSAEIDKPTIWVDMTLSYLNWRGGVSGIVRTQLAYARYLYSLDNNTRFFAYQYENSGGYLFEIKKEYLLWLFNDLDLSTAYSNFSSYWNDAEKSGINRNPFKNSGIDTSDPSYLSSFPYGSIVFFSGIDDMSEEGKYSPLRKAIEIKKENPYDNIFISQLIYDFTPILYPQGHLKSTCDNFEVLLDKVYQDVDFIVYGGKTAKRDGIEYQHQHNTKLVPSESIEFGSDITSEVAVDKETVNKILEKYNLTKGDFILTVGTIEPRKNHETLYKAYQMSYLEGTLDKMPKLFIAGKPGWKCQEFLNTLQNDDRFKNIIMVASPTDEELNTLYNNCAFTVLPSFYEGWSLTLPESLSKGKLCLTSDVDPLKEIAKDMVVYVNPLNTKAWKDKIIELYQHPNQVKSYEEKIAKGWHPKKWIESAQDLHNMLFEFYKMHRE